MKKFAGLLFAFLVLCSFASVSAKGHLPGDSIIFVESTNGFETSKIGPIESGKAERHLTPVAYRKNNINLKRLKKGESSVLNIMGLVEVGDGSIFEAAKNGGITKVLYVDRKCDQINAAYYFFYKKVTTIVYGE